MLSKAWKQSPNKQLSLINQENDEIAKIDVW